MTTRRCISGENCHAPEELRGLALPVDREHFWRSNSNGNADGYTKTCKWCNREHRRNSGAHAKAPGIPVYRSAVTGEKYVLWYDEDPVPGDEMIGRGLALLWED